MTFIPLETILRKQGYKFIVGMDEVGRGPLAGPVVCAAVILKENCRLTGLKESKQLTQKKREEFFVKILKNCLDYCIAVVSHTLIDKINILNAVRVANDLCIQGLNIKPDLALIDGRDKQIIDIPFKTIIKGDVLVKSIAAASVLAKFTRDKIMQHYDKQFPQYGFTNHKGYGTKTHHRSLEKYGFCAIHRKSFKLVKHENLSLW